MIIVIEWLNLVARFALLTLDNLHNRLITDVTEPSLSMCTGLTTLLVVHSSV